jgi:hypothetical protein
LKNCNEESFLEEIVAFRRHRTSWKNERTRSNKKPQAVTTCRGKKRPTDRDQDVEVLVTCKGRNFEKDHRGGFGLFFGG